MEVMIVAKKRNVNHRIVYKALAVLLASLMVFGVICFGTFPASTVAAEEPLEYENTETGYRALILDDSDRLTDNEEKKLLEYMKPITTYGNACFYASDGQTGDSGAICDETYTDFIGDPEKENGVLLLVNVDTEELNLSGYGLFPYWLKEGTTQGIIDDSINEFNTNGDYFGAEYVFTKYYEAIDSSDQQLNYEPVGEDAEKASEPVDTLSVKNKETGYESAILDEADLISDGEERKLLEDMAPFTTYGNAVFYTIDHDKGNTLDAATNKFWEMYGQDSDGAIFLIDMANRQISIYSAGTVSDHY